MALAGQLALGAVGGFFGGPVGFAIGSMIGSWLFAPDQEDSNQIIDPGAQEIPRVNQALRGVTMPILFGTNRVSSNIVWQNNFQTLRHESQESAGGGGKGGGSGMGGKGGAKGPTTVTYEYKWDLLYHFGMVSEDFNLFGGWIGPERMNDDTLVAISQGGAGNVNFFKSDVDRPQTAALTFEEGFFHPGFATGDTSAANWDHFETVELHAHRFPYTAYIGFKALNLGGTASLPQLSFEIGPGDVGLDFDSAYIGHQAHALTNAFYSGQQILKATDGRNYFVVGNDGGTACFSVHRIADGVRTDHINNTENNTHATTVGLDPGSNYDFTSSPGGFLISEKYAIGYSYDVGSGSQSNHAFVLYEIDANGLAQPVGGYAGDSGTIHSILSTIINAGISGEQTNDDPIVVFYENAVSASRDPQMITLPSINDMLGVVIEDSGSDEIDTRTADFNGQVGDYFGTHQTSRLFHGFGWFLPHVTIGLGPTWNTRFYFYIGKADVEADNDDPGAPDANSYVNTNKATYPNGWIGYFELGLVVDGAAVTVSAPVIANADFIDDTTKAVNVPFDDAGLNRNDAVDDTSDYHPAPYAAAVTSGEAEGTYAVLFAKSFSFEVNLTPSGSYVKGRLYLYNPLSGVFTQYADGEGNTYDSVDDIDITSRYNYTPQDRMLVLDQSTKEVFSLETNNSSDGDMDDLVIVSKFGDYTLGGGEDVLPPFIIHEILTSPVFGIGVDPANIDSTSYGLALNYCDSEDIRVSTIYNREGGALQHVELLLGLYGGFLTESGGKIKFGLNDLSVDPVRTLDNDHFVVGEGEAPVTVTRGARQESYNKVKVNYLDRLLEYRQNFIEINDEVDQDLHGIRPREFPPKFVMTEGTANKIAVRTLWSNLYAKDIYQFSLGPKDADLEPGDPVTVVDSFHPDPELSGAGVRARIISWDETDPYVFKVAAIKEVAYINVGTYAPNAATNASFNQLFGPSRAPADFRMYELPKEFQGANPTLFVGWNQLSPAMGARLYLSADGVSFAKADEIQPFIVSGIFADALPDRQAGHVEEQVQFYLFPDTRSTADQTGFSALTPTFVQTFALDDVSGEGRALGAGNLYIGSEMMAFEGLNLIGQNHYSVDKLYRGWGGTNIHDHSSGAFWHKHAGGVFSRTYNEDKVGNIIHYKVTPFNFNGVEFDISSIDARTHQIEGLYFRPQVQPPIRTFVESLITGTASDNLGALEIKHVHSDGTAVTFSWPDAARVRGYGTFGYGTGVYGRFTTDTTSHNWRVEVLSSDESTVVRCVTVDSGWFVYSLATNSEDFNGWQGDFSVRVTPFNDIGDAPRNRTKRLRLFEQV